MTWLEQIRFSALLFFISTNVPFESCLIHEQKIHTNQSLLKTNASGINNKNAMLK